MEGEATQPTILTSSTSKHKVKRGRRKSKLKSNKINETMNIVGNNAAGLLNKLKSLEMNLKTFQPAVYFVQETKCRRKNKVSHPDYIIVLEHIRKNCGGGG
jgi:hypothetical protein